MLILRRKDDPMKKTLLLMTVALFLSQTPIRAYEFTDRELQEDQMSLLTEDDFDYDIEKNGEGNKQAAHDYLRYLTRLHQRDFFQYRFLLDDSSKHVTITGISITRYLGTSKTVKLSSLNISDLPIKKVEAKAFTKTTKVIVPASVTYCAKGAFGNAKVIKDKNLIKLKNGAYQYYYRLANKCVTPAMIKTVVNGNKAKKNTLTLSKGKSVRLISQAQVNKKRYALSLSQMRYANSDPQIVSLKNGVVKAKKKGTATINAKLVTNEMNKYYTLTIKVK